MATSGRTRGGGKPTRRSKKRSVAKTERVETLDQISLSTFCSPARPHLLVASVRPPIAAAKTSRRRR